MHPHIRWATPADAEDLARLRAVFLVEAATADQPPPPALHESMRSYFTRHLAAGDFFAALATAGESGEIVATSGMTIRYNLPSIRYPTGREAYIMNMYTLPAWRSRGVAAQLLGRLLAKARDLGCGKVTLHALPKARPIYDRAGFQPSEHEMRLDLPALPGGISR